MFPYLCSCKAVGFDVVVAMRSLRLRTKIVYKYTFNIWYLIAQLETTSESLDILYLRWKIIDASSFSFPLFLNERS